eukprot:4700134-Amphidinium_carterae.1
MAGRNSLRCLITKCFEKSSSDSSQALTEAHRQAPPTTQPTQNSRTPRRTHHERGFLSKPHKKREYEDSSLIQRHCTSHVNTTPFVIGYALDFATVPRSIQHSATLLPSEHL